jgi:hypothetical protein
MRKIRFYPWLSNHTVFKVGLKLFHPLPPLQHANGYDFATGEGPQPSKGLRLGMRGGKEKKSNGESKKTSFVSCCAALKK